MYSKMYLQEQRMIYNDGTNTLTMIINPEGTASITIDTDKQAHAHMLFIDVDPCGTILRIEYVSPTKVTHVSSVRELERLNLIDEYFMRMIRDVLFDNGIDE